MRRIIGLNYCKWFWRFYMPYGFCCYEIHRYCLYFETKKGFLGLIKNKKFNKKMADAYFDWQEY